METRTAYAVCFFRVEGGSPVFVSSGIYSSSAGSITCEIRLVPMDVAQADGCDYAVAYSNLIAFLDSWGDRYRWFLDALKRDKKINRRGEERT